MAHLWGVCEVAMSQISVCADELRTRAVVHMSKASLPLGQPHHYSTSSDVSLLMQRPRAKLGDGSSSSDKLLKQLVLAASLSYDCEGWGTAGPTERIKGSTPDKYQRAWLREVLTAMASPLLNFCCSRSRAHARMQHVARCRRTWPDSNRIPACMWSPFLQQLKLQTNLACRNVDMTWRALCAAWIAQVLYGFLKAKMA